MDCKVVNPPSVADALVELAGRKEPPARFAGIDALQALGPRPMHRSPKPTPIATLSSSLSYDAS